MERTDEGNPTCTVLTALLMVLSRSDLRDRPGRSGYFNAANSRPRRWCLDGACFDGWSLDGERLDGGCLDGGRLDCG